MHGWYSYLEDHPKTSGEPDPAFHDISHGESFLALLESRHPLPRARGDGRSDPRDRGLGAAGDGWDDLDLVDHWRHYLVDP